MKYSICTTNYNTEDVVEQYMESILQHINPEHFEIVVVDNRSRDHSPDILRRYAKDYGNMRLISKKCSRGLGREIAFRNSRGRFVIQTDCDTLYRPEWKKFIDAYEEKKINIAVQAHYSGIYPRHLLEKVGGWRDLNYGEDLDLWMRLLKIESFKWSELVVGDNIKRRVHITLFEKYLRKFLLFRDLFTLRYYDPKYILKTIKNNAPKSYYYLFWIPFLTVARLYGDIRRARFKIDISEFNLDLYEKNIIDLGIKGKHEKWWEKWPLPLPLD